MQLTFEHLEKLEQAVAVELETLAIIANARLTAARKIESRLNDDTPPTREQAAATRLLIQFVSRPFRPLELLFKSRNRTRHDEDDMELGSANAALLSQALLSGA